MLSWADSPYAVPALFLLAFVESSFFPIPPDILLIALTLSQPEIGLYFAAITTMGSVLGGLLGYGIGWFGGRPLLLRFIGEQRVKSIHTLFERYEGWAILVAGFTPIPYKVFTIGAGSFYVNLKIFTLASLFSRGGRFFLVAGTIQLIGPTMKSFLEEYFDVLSVVIVIVVALGFYIARLLSKHLSGSMPA